MWPIIRARASPRSSRVVVAVGEVGVAHDRLSGDRGEGDVLRGQPRRCGDDHGSADFTGMVDRPLKCLHSAERSSDRSEQRFDPELLQERPVDGDQVTHLDQGETQSVRFAAVGVDRRRTGGTPAAAEYVRADHEEPVSVEWPARTDDVVPPAGPVGIVALVETGGMGVTGKGVADEDGVGRIFVQFAVGLVGDFDFPDLRSGVERQRMIVVEDDHPLSFDQSDARRQIFPDYFDLARAWSMSARMSSMFSMPTERRTRSSLTPASASSPSSSWEWVVVAGWIARDLASPMFARCEKSSSESMNFRPASRPPSTPNATSAPAPPGRIRWATS